VLLAADQLKNSEIAQRLGVTRPMGTKWRSRFAAESHRPLPPQNVGGEWFGHKVRVRVVSSISS
jgi:transposase